jgi:hypothetical protein
MIHEEIAAVFNFLRPEGGWILNGVDYLDAVYDQGVTPISKVEFEKGVVDYKSFSDKNDAKIANQKNAILEKLGLTLDEIKILLG